MIRILKQIPSMVQLGAGFLLVNVAIVAINIVLPRYLDTPKLQIEAITTLADELETEITPAQASLIEEVLHVHGRQETSCADLIFKQKIAAECFSIIAQQASRGVGDFKEDLEHIEVVAEYFASLKGKSIDARRDEEFVGLARSRELDQIALLNTMGDAIKPEFIQSISDGLIAQGISTAEKDANFYAGRIDELQNIIKLISSLPDEKKRSGEVIFEVVISNRGYADAIVPPNARLLIGGQSVPLVKGVSPLFDDGEGTASTEQPYEILFSGSVELYSYTVDRRNASAAEIDTIDTQLQSRASSPFKIVISTPTQTIELDSHLPSDTVSLEIRHN